MYTKADLVLQINVQQIGPNEYNFNVDKWPDDIKEMIKLLAIAHKGVELALERYQIELE